MQRSFFPFSLYSPLLIILSYFVTQEDDDGLMNFGMEADENSASQKSRKRARSTRRWRRVLHD